MYCWTAWIASEAGGCGPKATSFATWSYALAPSNPPVCAAGGAASEGGITICAGVAGMAGDEALAVAFGRAASWPQAPANNAATAATAIQNDLGLRVAADTIAPPRRPALARACGAGPRTTPA